MRRRLRQCSRSARSRRDGWAASRASEAAIFEKRAQWFRSTACATRKTASSSGRTASKPISRRHRVHIDESARYDLVIEVWGADHHVRVPA